jgi:hypothetical protein
VTIGAALTDDRARPEPGLTPVDFRHIESRDRWGGARVKADERAQREIPRSARPAGRDVLELWINLARRDWGSLVIIPADRNGSTAEIANTLADIGQRLSYGPVTAITVSTLEYGSALALADLQQHVERERRNWGRAPVSATAPEAEAGSPLPGPTAPAAAAAPQPAPADAAVGEPGPRSEALVVIPPARLIISVPPVVAQPLGLAAAEEADAVILAVRMNRSTMGDVKRTVHLVGRHRITGCFLVR